MRSTIQVAIDGYAGCGKSSTAKIVADKTAFIFIDSGAMYRAVTLFFLDRGVDFGQTDAVLKALGDIELEFRKEGAEQVLYLNGENVQDKIRSMQVNQNVSQVAALGSVREHLVAQQQALGKSQNIVMDGRDIGTVVFPQADVKVFMTADVTERARRRQLELSAKGEDIPLTELEENIQSRDHIDTTRDISPLRQAEDAVVIDTTSLTIEEQTRQVLSLIAQKTARQS